MYSLCSVNFTVEYTVYMGYKNGFRYLSYSNKEFKPVIHNRLYKHIVDNVAAYKYVTVDTTGKIINIVQNETMENILGANVDSTANLKFRIDPTGLVQYSKEYQDVWFNLEMNDVFTSPLLLPAYTCVVHLVLAPLVFAFGSYLASCQVIGL